MKLSREKKRKSIRIVALVCLLLWGYFFIGSSFSVRNEVLIGRANPKVSIGVGEDYDGWWQFGEWNFLTSLSSSSSDINVDATGTTVVNTSTSESLEENEIIYSLNAELIGGTSQVDFSFEGIAFFLPLNLFETSNSDYVYELDEINNKLSIKNNDSKEVGYVKFGSDLPYCDDLADPDACASLDTNFFWTYDEYQVYIFNVKNIEMSENNYNFNLDIKYSFLPSELAIKENNSIYSQVSFNNEESADLNEIITSYQVKEEQTLSLANLKKSNVEVSDEWLSEWGTATGNYDFYIKYNVNGNIAYDGNYTIKTNTVFTNGSVVAYGNGESYSNIISDELCKIDSNGNSTYNCNIIVGYNYVNDSLDTNYSMIVTGNDGSTVTREFSWDYEYSKQTDAKIPEGTNEDIRQVLLTDNSGIGAVNKLNNGVDIDFEWLIESSSSSMNKTTNGVVKAFNLWNLTNDGNNNYTAEIGSDGAVIDSSYSNSINPLNLNSDSYVIKSFYVQDDKEYDYVLNNGEYLLDSVIGELTSKEVYIKIGTSNYELIGTYKKDSNGNIVYVASNTKTSSNDNVTEENPVVLPDNVTDLKVKYTGNKAAIYMGVVVKTSLLNSDDVKNKIDSLSSSNSDIVLKNSASVTINNNEKNKEIATYLTSYKVNSNINSTSIVNNRKEDADSITYVDTIYEQVNFEETNKNIAESLLKEQRSATIYELLPLGAELDGNVIVKTYNSLLDCTSTVTSYDNYNGSGRTLLKIDVLVPSNIKNYYVGNTYIQSGYQVSFNIKYAAKSNIVYGNVLKKDVAYYSGNVLSEGFVNASMAPSTVFSDNNSQNIFKTIETTNTEKKFLFAYNTAQVEEITVSIGDYNKEVKSDIENNYLQEINVVEGSKYKYRLQYVYTSTYDEITNLVFLDRLESDYGSNKYFKGHLDSIDTSYLNNNGITTKVYYSTNKDVDFDNLDLNDTYYWSLTKPSDESTIVAIAVDCGDYVFKAAESISPMVDINMIAANNYEKGIDKKAYNSSVIKYNGIGSARTNSIKSDVVKVKLNEATIKLSATSSKGVGTAEVPEIVEGSYSYNVTLTNTSDIYEYNNVELEMVIPRGLSVSDVVEKTSITNGNLGEYTFDTKTRILKYEISELKANEVRNIQINVDVVLSAIDVNSNLEASFKVSKISNYDYNGIVNNVYNRLEMPSLTFNKFAKTQDTDGYSDEATMLIAKNEVYSYRVNVNNVSVIDAKDILVVDQVPNGLTVIEDSITNGGVYNSTDRTITWRLNSLAQKTSINLDYNVQVGNDITLGTVYRSSAHISVVNPLDSSLMLYDTNTNIVSTLYQVVSDIKISNKLVGALADKDKEFEYKIEFTGDESSVGTYYVYDKTGKQLDNLVLDYQGIGSYSVSLKADEEITFKMLLGGINYTVKQELKEGYTTTTNTENEFNDTNIMVSGVTSEERLINHEFTNTYSVRTSVDLTAKVTYDKDMNAGMFKVKLANNNYEDIKEIDENGNINFDTLTYDNVVGRFTYEVSQINMGGKVSYDTNTYKVIVNVTNDGKGNLNKDIKYYNMNDEEVSELVFNNEYLPNGLVINSYNSSDYINEDIEFNYTLTIGGIAGQYKVLDSNKKEIDTIEVLDDEDTIYEFKLKSNEKITIVEIPMSMHYVIRQDSVPYYTSKIDGLEYNVDQGDSSIVNEGIFDDATIQVVFNNNYVTRASFNPVLKVSLENKALEDKEFKFTLKDISEGSSNGYTETIYNDANGNINFGTINYTRPGKYVYEVSQVKGESKNFVYDLEKCLLTIVLKDNGDGTMEVESVLYEYLNNSDGFNNKYFEKALDDNGVNNPDTTDRSFVIFAVFIMAITILIVSRKLKIARYNTNIKY